MHGRIRTTIAVVASPASASAAAVLSLLLAGGCSGGLAPALVRPVAAAPDEGRPRPPVMSSALAPGAGPRGCIRLRCGRLLCPLEAPLPDPSPAPPDASHAEACTRGGGAGPV